METSYHLFPGDSAAGTAVSMGMTTPQGAFVSPDKLHVGRLARFESTHSWNELRKPTLDQLDLNFSPSVVSYARVIDALEPLSAAKRVDLHAAVGLHDQVALAFFIHILGFIGVARSRVYLRIYSQYPNGRPILGVGELSPKRLATLTHPVQMSDETAAQFDELWSALIRPDPTWLSNWSHSVSTIQPGPAASIKELLFYFPDAFTGLTHWDATLLGQCQSRQIRAARAVGEILGTCYDTNVLADDDFLFARIRAMGDANRTTPLLRLTAASPSNQRLFQVARTKAGTQALRGKLGAHPTFALEHWVGGTRVSTPIGNHWVRSGHAVIPSGAA